MQEQLNELSHNLTLAHQQFVTVAHKLDLSARTKVGVCGDWSPKDVIAHLLGWDHSLLTFIVEPENFVPPADVDLFNQTSVLASKDLSWNDLMAQFAQNFAQLALALTSVESTMKIYPRVTSWAAGRIADYHLHVDQLASWQP